MFNFQFGDFYNSSPNWFDWLNFLGTIVVSTFSIFFAYCLGERNYKRDKKEKAKQEEELMISENNLFRENLKELKKQISKQESYFKKYLTEKEFNQLCVNSSVQVNFLKNIDVKQLYRKVKNNKNKVEQINTLFSYLYGISNFESAIQDEYRTFVKRYNELEIIFKNNYGTVFYHLFHQINNKRIVNYPKVNGGIGWEYDSKDEFMLEYVQLRSKFIKENKIKVDRKRISELLKEIAEKSNKYIPKDFDAIQVNHFANEAYCAFVDMEAKRKSHYKVIDSYLKVLEKLKKKIEEYEELVNVT
ncbi:hypothetical protein [Capnocytophaga cynodegmi]|uniref:Uncharacterized protein n=1 Tax=Capnocytophaga cynodegmi TaxID=28189 RepID=A0A0B7HPN4_9FLAO|nr:hypothetical protein [Capnocytophaga cynodegmi]CEN38342.1 hypothetical protein CCYN74_30139 [Capnocytophaga cynodegmi]CEN41245.1 hypothetical protein CCYN49044_460019 [Capnocytophaga cynodegmi]